MDFSSLYRRITAIYSAVPRKLSRGYAFPPLQVFIELTRRCNLRCVMCQNLPYMEQMSPPDEKKEELTLEELVRIISETPRFALITFTGGEPLLRSDFEQILKYTSERRRCHVITNGVLLDEEMARLMVACGAKRLFGRGLIFVGVSVHGPAQLHDRITQLEGSFTKATDAARRIAEIKAERRTKLPFLYLCTVLTRETVETLPDMVQIAHDVSADIFNITLRITSLDLSIVHGATMETMLRYPRAPDRIEGGLLREKLSETLRRCSELGMQIRLPRMPISEIANYYAGKWSPSGYTCQAPWAKTFISPHGSVYACHQLEVGSLREKPLKAIWNNANYRRFRQELKRHKAFPICAACCEIEHPARTNQRDHLACSH